MGLVSPICRMKIFFVVVTRKYLEIFQFFDNVFGIAESIMQNQDLFFCDEEQFSFFGFLINVNDVDYARSTDIGFS